MNLAVAASQIESLPENERVRLRRGRRSAGLWRILAEQDISAEPREEPRYELLLRAIALMGQGPMEYGRALYEANYSQLRLERLLEAEDVLDESEKTVRFLGSQSDMLGQAPDWSQLNDYLQYRNDRARRAIARSYFLSKHNDQS